MGTAMNKIEQVPGIKTVDGLRVKVRRDQKGAEFVVRVRKRRRRKEVAKKSKAKNRRK